MPRTATCRLRAYAIHVNGAYMGNSLGNSAQQAIAVYCKANGIQSTRGMTIGNCGNPLQGCAKNMNTGCYPCGSRGKCQGVYTVQSSVGLMTASLMQ